MVMRVIGTLQCDVPSFLAGIHIVNAEVSQFLAKIPHAGVQDFGKSLHLAECGQTHLLGAAVKQQRLQIGRIGDEIIGFLAGQPFHLFIDRCGDVEHRAGTGGKKRLDRFQPIIQQHAVGIS